MDFQIKPHYFFGKNVVNELNQIFTKDKPKKVLLLFGFNSAKKNGAYSDVKKIIDAHKISFIEFWGLEPNPKITTCEKAVCLGVENEIDLIIAIGGGSVIDAAKVIGHLIANHGFYQKAWDYVDYSCKKVENETHVIPLYSIITIAGTASENNAGSVISNSETREKRVVHNLNYIPKICFLDPQYTFTASKWQLATSGFDCLAHLLEQYLGDEPSFGWREEYLFANMRNIIKYLPIGIKEPENFDAKANIMFTSTFSLNPLTTVSFNHEGQTSDWKVHSLEHALSALYDIAHGAGLALIYPKYLRIQKALNQTKFINKFVRLSQLVFNVKDFEAGVVWLENFIIQIGLLTQLKEFKLNKKIDQKADCDFCLKHFLIDCDVDLNSVKYKYLKDLGFNVFKSIIKE